MLLSKLSWWFSESNYTNHRQISDDDKDAELCFLCPASTWAVFFPSKPWLSQLIKETLGKERIWCWDILKPDIFHLGPMLVKRHARSGTAWLQGVTLVSLWWGNHSMPLHKKYDRNQYYLYYSFRQKSSSIHPTHGKHFMTKIKYELFPGNF